MRRLALILVLLIATVICMSSVRAQISDQERRDAINGGLAYLAIQQDLNPASPDYGKVDDLDYPYYPVSLTAFAVLKWEEHAKKFLKIDPFNDTYIYKPNIVAGWKYIFKNAVIIDINLEHGVDDPDVKLKDGKGVYFLSPGTDRPMYEMGIVMTALEASCHKEFTVNSPGIPVDGWTYENVMKDAVDYLSWGQNDESNYGRGGWNYGAYDDGTPVPPHYAGNLEHSDNSVSQWPVLGLMSAELWDIYAPDWVKTELLDNWLAYSQNQTNGGFGYRDSLSLNIARTAAGLIQLTYCDINTSDARWNAARQYICNNWNSGNIGNLYAMYGVMKASMTAQPEEIWDFCTHKWQDEYDEWLIDDTHRNDDGFWKGQYAVLGEVSNSKVLATEFALLILQKVAPEEVEPVPSFTHWGLMGLIFVLLALATWVFLRRRKVVGVR